jgi:hypothetical protein
VLLGALKDKFYGAPNGDSMYTNVQTYSQGLIEALGAVFWSKNRHFSCMYVR